jgi:hypothetical protein
VSFDFNDAICPIAAEDPPGTWLHTALTVAQYRQHIREAKAATARLDPRLQPLFSEGIEELERRLESIRDDGNAFALFAICVEVSPDGWEAFAKACESESSAGLETRVRHGTWSTTYALYVPQVGSLVADRWHHGSGLSYQVGRAADLRQSFVDGAPQFEVPARRWRPLYTGHIIAEAHDKPASVRAFTFQGCRYAITSTVSKGRYWEASAWTIGAGADWHGPTYTYAQQCCAWDGGRKERGDQRGLEVIVRGQHCVLDRYTRLVDPNDDSYADTDAECEDETTQTDELEEDQALEEACGPDD